MNFSVGDLVSRNSHNNDIIFKIMMINNNYVQLQGVNVRLSADSFVDDLKIVKDIKINDDEIIQRNINNLNIDRNNYFYIPGKILHIDGDEYYLKKAIDTYSKYNINAIGYFIKENEMPYKIEELLKKHHPDIVVITGLIHG